jgi:hypothetical protein
MIRGSGDTTKSLHLLKSFDLNNDGKIGENERGGEIFGRTIQVKSSKRSKGYQRSV